MTPEKFFEDPKIIEEMSNIIEMIKRGDIDAMRTVMTVVYGEFLTLRSLLNIDRNQFDALRDEPLRILERLIKPDEGEG